MRVPERLLLGPGPSPVSSRVMQAMGAAVISHLDPAMMSLLDDLRERLGSAFGAGDGALSLAISGTGTSGMEAAVANLTTPGARALVRTGLAIALPPGFEGQVRPRSGVRPSLGGTAAAPRHFIT